METFLIVFVIGLWIYLSLPQKKSPKPDPWEELGRALGTAVKSTAAPAEVKKSGGGKKETFPNLVYWAILAGLAVYLLR